MYTSVLFQLGLMVEMEAEFMSWDLLFYKSCQWKSTFFSFMTLG